MRTESCDLEPELHSGLFGRVLYGGPKFFISDEAP
jgi:hypothetical protein